MPGDVTAVQTAQQVQVDTTPFPTTEVKASIIAEGSSYYVMVEGQHSAAEGPEKMKVDRKLANAIADALKSGGRISVEEVNTLIMPALEDGPVYGKGEQALVKLMYSALDGRKTVLLNGDRINFTKPAEDEFKTKTASFFGSLGARSRALNDGFEMSKPNPYI